MAAPRERLFLLDGNSLLNRAYFALPPLATRTGQPTNAVYGFTLMLTRLLEDEKPDALGVAFDKSAPTFRHQAYQEYKAHRPRMDDELRSQFPLVKAVLEAHRIPVFELEGYEADDVIGTLAQRAAEKGMEVVIVTGDKDALQLVSDQVTVMLVRKGIKEMERFDRQAILDRWGISPEQIADLKGLMGDPSDNIPGVPGIGEKTALKLLWEYGSVEALLERREQLKGRVAKTLEEHGDDALLSKRLATIDRNVPIEINWETLKRKEPDLAQLSQLFMDLEFRSLLEPLRERMGESPLSSAQAADVWDGPVEVVRDLKEVTEAVERLKKAEVLGVMAIGEKRSPVDVRVAGVAVMAGERLTYFPIGHKEGRNVAEEALPGPLRELFASEVPKVCHDAKEQILALGSLGLALNHVQEDTMLAAYLLNPGQGDHSLEGVAMRYAGIYPPAWSGEDSAGDKRQGARTGRFDPAEEPAEKLAQRAGVRLGLVRDLVPKLSKKLEQEGVDWLYREVELPLASVLADMERVGVRVDVGELAAMSKEMDDELAALEARAHELAGEPFNLRSPGQLARILFDKLGLPVIAKGKTGPSTSADVLEALADQHEIARVLLEYRQVHKLKSSYVDALPGMVDPKTGRIHTTFHQEVAATGRLSSANPNLQNIPVRTRAGQKIRKTFIPREGWLFLKADYSQIELRVLAHMSGDPHLIEAFRRGEDIHAKTASEIFGIPLDQVTEEQRSAAKAINFGIVYGISSFGLAKGTGLSQHEAQAFIDEYFQRYPAVKQYMDETIARAKKTGYVTTIFGRRRYLPDIGSRRYAERKFAERTAINTPIQGSAADIIKMAMLRVHRRIAREGLAAVLLLQVHDELLFEAPPDELLPLARLVKEEMEGVVRLEVPLKVDLKQGNNWLEGEEVQIHA